MGSPGGVLDRILRTAVASDLLLAGPVLATVAGIVVKEQFLAPIGWSTPGRMVRGESGPVHVVERAGTGPTVVLESGLGTPLTAWTWVLDGLDTRGRGFVSHDRPGIGWSTVAAPRSAARTRSDDLAALLRTVGAPAPYVLVGHSLGGLLIKAFAHRFPELTAGMVFVDSSHPDQYRRSPAQRAGLPASERDLAVLTWRSALRLPVPQGAARSLDGLPEHVRESTVQAMFRHRTLRTAQRELALSRSDWATAAAALTAVSCPVAVVTAGGTVAGDPDHEQLQRELAALSVTSRFELVPDAGHLTLLTEERHAARVLDAIDWVVTR